MPEFYHPDRETLRHGGVLPHWQQGEVMQFVTFRLADSMPHSKLRQWKEELVTWKALHPEPWTQTEQLEYHHRFTRKLEFWLDEGHGACIFADPIVRSDFEETIMNDDVASRLGHHAQPCSSLIHSDVSVKQAHASLEGSGR